MGSSDDSSDKFPPDVKQQLKDLDLYFSDDELDKLAAFRVNNNDQEAADPDPGYEDVLCSPIIEVFSVIVETSTGFNDDTPSEIYGSIQVMQGQNTSFHLYDRGCADSETISKHGSLSLIGPKERVMLPFTGVGLDLCLRDRIRQVEVVKGSLSFDSLITQGKEEDCFDKLRKAVVRGEHGCAHVYYAIFQFGIWCTLEVAITDLRGNGSGSYSDIYGSLVASFDNSRRYCSTDDELKFLESTIFKKSCDKPIHILVGNPIELSRRVLVMPAYSTLKVEANLWDSSGNIINDKVELLARHRGENKMFIKSSHASLRVKVRWWDAYRQFYKYPMLDAKSKVVLEESKVVPAESEVVEDIEMPKKHRVFHGGQPRSSVSGNLPVSKYFGTLFTEVFSVCIGGIKEEIHALCGTIIVQNGLRKYYIYNKDESCFESLEDNNNIASTEGPDHVIPNCDFFIDLKLKDPVRDLEVSRGYFGWNVGQLERNNMSWYNKRMCSVVRGKDGFAAVHHMVFKNALEAHVEVRFFSNSPADVPANVHGHLVAYYRDYDYSKSYQRKYYRSRLFNLPQNKSVELMTGSEITLSRSVVAVPTFSALFIEADLEVCGLTDVCKGSISGTEEFEIDMSCCTQKEIKGDNCWIELSVKFQR